MSDADEFDLVIESRVDLPPESLKLARKTLLNSSVCAKYAILVGTGVEMVGGIDMIYFDFSYGDEGESRIYAE